MSRTDKTNPYWLKIARGDTHGAPREHHHLCQDAKKYGYTPIPECNLAPPVPNVRRNGERRGCQIWVGAYDPRSHKVWGHHRSNSYRKAEGFEGRNRMLLRQMKLAWKSAPLEDIDSTENAPRNKRHSHNRWLWD